MTAFIVRVELHGTSDYDGLHQMMQQAGCLRHIRANDGKVYALPSATYYREAGASETAAMICNQVKQIADRTGFRNEVLVTSAEGGAWLDLTEVKQPTSAGLGALGQNALFSPSEAILGTRVNDLGLGGLINSPSPAPRNTLGGGLNPSRW